MYKIYVLIKKPFPIFLIAVAISLILSGEACAGGRSSATDNALEALDEDKDIMPSTPFSSPDAITRKVEEMNKQAEINAANIVYGTQNTKLTLHEPGKGGPTSGGAHAVSSAAHEAPDINIPSITGVVVGDDGNITVTYDNGKEYMLHFVDNKNGTVTLTLPDDTSVNIKIEGYDRIVEEAGNIADREASRFSFDGELAGVYNSTRQARYEELTSAGLSEETAAGLADEAGRSAVRGHVFGKAYATAVTAHNESVAALAASVAEQEAALRAQIGAAANAASNVVLAQYGISSDYFTSGRFDSDKASVTASAAAMTALDLASQGLDRNGWQFSTSKDGYIRAAQAGILAKAEEDLNASLADAQRRLDAARAALDRALLEEGVRQTLLDDLSAAQSAFASAQAAHDTAESQASAYADEITRNFIQAGVATFMSWYPDAASWVPDAEAALAMARKNGDQEAIAAAENDLAMARIAYDDLVKTAEAWAGMDPTNPTPAANIWRGAFDEFMKPYEASLADARSGYNEAILRSLGVNYMPTWPSAEEARQEVENAEHALRTMWENRGVNTINLNSPEVEEQAYQLFYEAVVRPGEDAARANYENRVWNSDTSFTSTGYTLADLARIKGEADDAAIRAAWQEQTQLSWQLQMPYGTATVPATWISGYRTVLAANGIPGDENWNYFTSGQYESDLAAVDAEAMRLAREALQHPDYGQDGEDFQGLGEEYRDLVMEALALWGIDDTRLGEIYEGARWEFIAADSQIPREDWPGGADEYAAWAVEQFLNTVGAGTLGYGSIDDAAYAFYAQDLEDRLYNDFYSALSNVWQTGEGGGYHTLDELGDIKAAAEAVGIWNGAVTSNDFVDGSGLWGNVNYELELGKDAYIADLVADMSRDYVLENVTAPAAEKVTEHVESEIAEAIANTPPAENFILDTDSFDISAMREMALAIGPETAEGSGMEDIETSPYDIYEISGLELPDGGLIFTINPEDEAFLASSGAGDETSKLIGVEGVFLSANAGRSDTLGALIDNFKAETNPQRKEFLEIAIWALANIYKPEDGAYDGEIDRLNEEIINVIIAVETIPDIMKRGELGRLTDIFSEMSAAKERVILTYREGLEAYYTDIAEEIASNAADMKTKGFLPERLTKEAILKLSPREIDIILGKVKASGNRSKVEDDLLKRESQLRARHEIDVKKKAFELEMKRLLQKYMLEITSLLYGAGAIRNVPNKAASDRAADSVLTLPYKT